MGRKYDPKGDIRHSHDTGTNDSHEQAKLLPIDHFPGAVDQARMLGICRLFQCFVHMDDGYLKVRREVDGMDIHLTWTWTMGKNHRSYVYVRVELGQLGYGLELLLAKVNNVIEGRVMPTPDRFKGN